MQFIIFSYIVHGEYPLEMQFNSQFVRPEYQLEIPCSTCSAIIRFGPRFSQGPMPKHDASLKGKVFFCITTPKHEGTFGGVVRELIHMTFGSGFASASVKERRQDGI